MNFEDKNRQIQVQISILNAKLSLLAWERRR